MTAADELQRTAWELRMPFLEWCGELAQRNDSDEWWASPLASRNPHERFFERVVMLALGRELPRLGSPAQRQVGPLRRALSRLRPEDSHPRHRRAVLARHGLLAPQPFAGDVLLFTWVDERSFAEDGSYRDPHLGPLAELLRGRGLDVVHLARVLPGMPFAEAVERLAASGERFLFPDAYLTLDDHRSCAARAGAFSPELTEGPVEGSAELAAAAAWAGRPAQAAALIYEAVVRRLAEAGVRPARIIHTYEGHGWELTLARATRRYLPETQLIGYENLNMPRLVLSMFPAPVEPRPLPHRIVTNGPAYADVLRREGWPADAVVVGCGLRHSPGLAAHERPADGAPLRLLAATEIAPDRAVELVEKARSAFGDDLVVKAHPLVPRSSLPRGANYDDRPLADLLASTDVLLHTWSGAAYDALALGIPSVFVRADASLDLDPLEFAPDVHWQARTPQDLVTAAKEIAAVDFDAWRPRALAAAKQAIAPLTLD